MIRWLAIAACLMATPVAAQMVSTPYQVTEDGVAAPTGDQDLSFVANYVRIAPNIGIGGRLTDDGVARAKAAGFKTLIDLRQPNESGVAEEKAAAEALGLRYISIPMPREAEDIPDILPKLIKRLETAGDYPILLHCASGNRAGAAWALYRAERGVPPIIAIGEGRAAGMKSRESVVRELLDLE